MKDKLTGFAIGLGAALAAMAIYGFGSAQTGDIGRYRIYTTGEVRDQNGDGTNKTYLVDTSKGKVWYEVSGTWAAIRTPNNIGD